MAARSWLGQAVAVGVVAMAGCASAPTAGETAPPASPAKSVERRAQARWDVLIAGDVAKAYEYLSPGTRQIYTRENYTALVKPGLWKKARVDRVECPEAELCEVVVVLDYVYRGTPLTTPLRETWTKSGEEWWFVLK
jgi:hypothetical protein